MSKISLRKISALKGEYKATMLVESSLVYLQENAEHS